MQLQSMSEVYEFTSVNAFAEDPARQIVSFSTEAGKNVSIQDEGPGKLDIQFVRRALIEHKVELVWVGTFPGDSEILDVSQPTRQ